jgi:predicted ATPase/tetratricopeptide (TPR) repeat protein
MHDDPHDRTKSLRNPGFSLEKRLGSERHLVPAVIFAFNDCEMDLERRELRRGGRTIHVEPQVFDVLIHLIRHRDRVVTKDELLDAVWEGRIVSETTLSSRISAARRAIGDSGGTQDVLRTVARRGFRFCGEVEERIEAGPRATASSLPAQATSFIGRDQDVAEVKRLLSSSRLVTLTGVGGVGKTRLAIHVAAEAGPTYSDGVRLVELATVAELGATSHAVAGAVGVVQQPGRTIEESLTAALAGRRLLLVLDNCEHLIQAIAPLAQQILARCAHVTLLATSREALVIDGEQTWPVPPLACDGVAPPASRLFVERARAAAPDLVLGADDAVVGEVCRQLDGIPLAIELAAARVRSLSPAQIRDRLDERFRLLTGGSRRAVERHHTLRRAIQWSYDLLSPAERIVLARASVFTGGFRLGAAERVCGGREVAPGDVLDHLDSLVRKSLIVVSRTGAAARYGLLETIRQFGEERLAEREEAEAVRQRHAQFYADDSAAHFEIFLSPRQRLAYEWLDHEIGNLRAAFRWASDRGRVEIASNIGDMGRFSVHDEAAHWPREIVDRARGIRHRRLTVLLTWAASSGWGLGRLEEARRYGEEAISLVADPEFEPFVWAYVDLAMIAAYEGDTTRALELGRAGANHPADRGDRTCLAFLPYLLTIGGRDDEARGTIERTIAEVEAAGVPSAMSCAHWAKGKAFAATDPAVALAAYERASMIARESGNRFWEVMAVLELAALQARAGDPGAALASFRRMLELWRRSAAELMFVTHGLGSLVVLLERLGAVLAAATLNGPIRDAVDSNPFVPELPDAVRRLRERLGASAFEEASRRGRSMPLYQLHDFAVGEVEAALARIRWRS